MTDDMKEMGFAAGLFLVCITLFAYGIHCSTVEDRNFMMNCMKSNTVEVCESIRSK